MRVRVQALSLSLSLSLFLSPSLLLHNFGLPPLTLFLSFFLSKLSLVVAHLSFLHKVDKVSQDGSELSEMVHGQGGFPSSFIFPAVL